MGSPNQSDVTLCVRVLHEARPCWPHLAGILSLGALSALLALFNPIPSKIVVDAPNLPATSWRRDGPLQQRRAGNGRGAGVGCGAAHGTPADGADGAAPVHLDTLAACTMRVVIENGRLMSAAEGVDCHD